MRMSIRQIARASLLAALLSPVAPHLASADAIDGEWCMGTSHFTIGGPNILTPRRQPHPGQLHPPQLRLVALGNEPGAGSQFK